MRNMISQQGALYLLIAILALVPAYAALTDSPYLVGEFRRYMIFAIVVVCLDLVLGYGGLVCFGHAMFFGIGAYAAGIYSWYFASKGLPGVLLDASVFWALAALAGGMTAFLVGFVSVRTTGVYFIMITLAFAQLAFFVFTGIKSLGGDEGFRFAAPEHLFGVLSLKSQPVFYYVTFAALFGVLYLMHRLVNSRFGFVIQGSRENNRRMHGLGFETFRYQLVCFTLAGAIAGFAGGVFAIHESFISPSIMSWNRSGELIVMVLIGGARTLVGPIYGAIVFLVLESFLPEYSEHWMLFFGPALIVIVLVANRGIFGSLPRRGAGRIKAVEERHVA